MTQQEQLTQWIFEPAHCKIGFSVTHFGITETEGHFTRFEGAVATDTDDFSDARVTMHIDVSSIDTLEAQRNAHLLSADFFDAARYPRMTFVSTDMHVVAKNTYKMTGDLTIRGVPKPVELDVMFTGIVPKDPFGHTKAGLKVTGTINRKEWGMTWNNIMDFGGLAVGEQVRINCQIELQKQ
ncbi:YceI family protein [Fibrisoma limi BUZ 3]|uniref:YceI family protein n=1 Tax=Fibrisoma limi BUZ 3 TaxID=1185876 RepID=I2GGA5_9BACT|nr:YceI family protein [Fibrisoma limi]CCH52930.1 YceI family protein [Fibrisoma limi BUZ 3]